MRRPGRHAAGHRAGRRPDPGDVPGGDPRQPHRTPQGADHRLPGRRDRHGSLRACVEWSYELCSETEQKFWARSSVFAGDTTWRPPPPSVWPTTCRPAEILDIVSGLVDQSIVLAEDDRHRPHAVPDAHRHPAVRAGAGGEGRRAPRHAGAARHLVRGTGRAVRRRGGGRTSRTGFGCFAWRTRTCGPPLATSPGRPRVPRPAWSWRGNSTWTGPPAVGSTRPAIGWARPRRRSW